VKSELVREAAWSLREWDQGRDPDGFGRCIGLLEAVTQLRAAKR
jgi:hypothetical protein